jgi:hypothetical protein
MLLGSQSSAKLRAIVSVTVSVLVDTKVAEAPLTGGAVDYVGAFGMLCLTPSRPPVDSHLSQAASRRFALQPTLTPRTRRCRPAFLEPYCSIRLRANPACYRN